MTWRAVLIGLLLGLFVAATAYFNDYRIAQTPLIGNFLPISVFGVTILLLLVANPLLRVLGPRWPLSGAELAVVTSLALAGCAWPTSGFFRGFTTITSLPQHWLQTRPNWRAAHVMSYLPGGSAEIAPGHVTDWHGLARRIAGANPVDHDTAATPLIDLLPIAVQEHLARLAARDSQPIATKDARELLRSLNEHWVRPTTADTAYERVPWQALTHERVLPSAAAAPLDERQRRLDAFDAVQAELRELRPGSVHGALDAARELQRRAGVLRREAAYFEQRANRAAIAAVFEEYLRPAPAGGDLLVAQGRVDPHVVEPLILGSGVFSVERVPWESWWPTLALWGGLALLLGVAAICLALIVHPQWSGRELLAFPVARFVEELVQRREGARLPEVARSHVFWLGMLALLAFHGINGLSVWHDGWFLEIPRTLQLSPLRELFPNASTVENASAYFEPTIYLSVIAFAYFLQTQVSLSVGIAPALFMGLAATLLSQGVQLDQGYAEAGKGNMLRFGAYLGSALMIAYVGRRYYARVVLAALGVRIGSGTPEPRYAVWAARALAVAFVLAVCWMQRAGLDWLLAFLMVSLILLTSVVAARIVAETGLFYLQPWWLPMAVLTALFGIEAIGPTSYIVMALASLLLVGDPRETLMPFISQGLRMVERTGPTSSTRSLSGGRLARLAPWLLVSTVASFVVAGVMSIALQYEQPPAGEGWSREALPQMGFTELARHHAELDASGTLAGSLAVRGLDRIWRSQPQPGTVWWGLTGVVLVVATTGARLRLPWWPLHPVAFLIWGSVPITRFAFSFLIGWIIKVGVTQVGGARGYQSLKPLAIGVIAGELLAGLSGVVIGAIYYWVTRQAPPSYAVFPG